jgi:hypothetical protein
LVVAVRFGHGRLVGFFLFEKLWVFRETREAVGAAAEVVAEVILEE